MPNPGRTRATTVEDAFARRRAPNRALFDTASAVVDACAAMAERFRGGGVLFVLGAGAAASDAQHVAVEFIHPVLVGKRALPARQLPEASALPALARPDDMALAIAPGELDADLLAALRAGRERGLLTVAMLGAGGPSPDADHVLRAAGDRLVAQETQVTTYHLLWELVHVHLEYGDVVPAQSAPEPAAACDADGHCVTCSDEAVPVRVAQLLGDGLALVDTGGGTEEISVALVDARVGDTVLVHAREAIGVVAP